MIIGSLNLIQVAEEKPHFFSCLHRSHWIVKQDEDKSRYFVLFFHRWQMAQPRVSPPIKLSERTVVKSPSTRLPRYRRYCSACAPTAASRPIHM
jgi:hypothetical protein